MRRFVPFVLSAALLTPAGCARPTAAAAAASDLDRLDQQLADGRIHDDGDPVLAAAVRDPIAVDPGLTQQSNARAVRPAPRPDPGAMPPDALGAPADTSRAGDLKATPAPLPGCPQCATARRSLTLGALAERTSTKGVAACAGGLSYATIWSTRLPAALALYPDARVAEAAGNDAGGCALRVVSFSSNATLGRVSDWYYGHLTRAGFAPEHRTDGGEHVLGGSRGDAAFMIYLRPHEGGGGGGTDVDLVSNAGR